MMRYLTLGAALILTSLSLGTMAHGTCFHTNVHTFAASGSVSAEALGVDSTAGSVNVWDTNVADCDGDGLPGDWDGTLDAGIGGAAFGFGPWVTQCDNNLDAAGGSFVVTDLVAANVGFWVGADDQSGAPNTGQPTNVPAGLKTTLDLPDLPLALAPPVDTAEPEYGIQSCLTDGVIAPDVDADDCLVGLFVNTGNVGACVGGSDGLVWVILVGSGVVTSSGIVVTDEPTVGTITAF